MRRLFLIRHGESTYNAEGRIQGHQDPPLSELGLRQAEAIARRLCSETLDAVYSSDLMRASATAEMIAAPRQLPVLTTPFLRESRLGVIEGLTRSEMEEMHPQLLHEWRREPLTARPPGAESIEDVVARCRAFLAETLPDDSQGSRLVIVGHGGSLRGIVVAGLELPTEAYRRMHFSNASLSVIELGENPAIWLLNDTSHLDSLRTDEEEVDSVAH